MLGEGGEGAAAGGGSIFATQRKRKMFYWSGSERPCSRGECRLRLFHFGQCTRVFRNSLTQWSVKLIVAATQWLRSSRAGPGRATALSWFACQVLPRLLVRVSGMEACMDWPFDCNAAYFSIFQSLQLQSARNRSD